LDIFPEKTPITIRTLEGETDIEVSNEMYIMIGSFDEIYPISAYKLAKSYTACDTPLLASKIDFEYAPSVINKNTFESVKIMDYAKCCIPTGESQIYAMPLTRKTKVFTDWKQDGYFSGNLGDYIAVRTDDMNDVYIIRRMIFDYTYVEI
jgi:phosphoglycolate phosphatase